MVIVLFKDVIYKFYKRPILEIRIGNDEPFTRKVLLHGKLTDFVRLEVINKGNPTARGCAGCLIKIINPYSKKERTDFDPVNLHWVNREE